VLARQGKTVFHEKSVLLIHDTPHISAFIYDYFFQNLLVDGSLSLTVEAFVVVQFRSLHEFCIGGNINFNRFISSQVSSRFNFFLSESWVKEISSRIIEIKRIHRSREERS
jgi:hypothetical protein